MPVGDWFASFCAQQRIGQTQRSTIALRTERITSRLNVDFRGLNSGVANRFYVGSYGRGTAIPSVSDIDLLYEMPPPLYQQYHTYTTNGQSAMLAAVRASLMRTYSSSAISGDGQVVVIRFDDGIKVEVLPAFENVSHGYTFADSNSGGAWRTCKPKQEMNAFLTRNAECNGNLVELGRMARAWRDTNTVPMSGMLIDTLAYQFIAGWDFREESYLYYDWLTRDFFAFLANIDTAKAYWLAPGSGSYVLRDGGFEYKARQAELRAKEAIDFQTAGRERSAKQKYREIYGTAFPD